jgi:predicted RNA-binding Zn-ribbon protein involved in translation (DUF1610 family)
MPVTQATPFHCPTCGADYKLVRVETKELVPDQQISCRKCGGPLPGSEGHLILKYFLVDRGRRRASGALPRNTLKTPVTWACPSSGYTGQQQQKESPARRRG